MSGMIKDGRVVGTNVDAMTCDVELEGGGRITGIKMRRGEHVTFGDQVVICKTGKKAGAWYVVGHVYGVGDVPDGMMEGGRGIVSPSGSSVLLHPNGDVVMSDGNLSRVALIPSKNLVEMHVRNYRMISTYGSVLWEPEAFNVNVGTGGSDVRLVLGGAGNAFGAGEWGVVTGWFGISHGDRQRRWRVHGCKGRQLRDNWNVYGEHCGGDCDRHQGGFDHR